MNLQCVHGADNATFVNGRVMSSQCETCVKQEQLEAAWKLPAYEGKRSPEYLKQEEWD